MDLNEDFRILVFKYGITSVIEYAENFVKESYDEINKIHTRLFVKVHVDVQKVIKEVVVKGTPLKVEEPVKEVVKIVETLEMEEVDGDVKEELHVEELHVEEPPKKTKKCVKKVKQIEKVQEIPEDVTEEDSASQTEDSYRDGGNISEEGVESTEEENPKKEEKKRKEDEKREQNRIAKKKQTEAQRITFEKNKTTGINPYDMLTKDNLEKWLITEERTYADIAKNIVGCSDKEVSLAAKRFQVKSLYMGENGLIKAGRKKRKVNAE